MHRATAKRMAARLFHRNGYVRLQNKKRVKKEGWSQYKKGDEVRLIAADKKELRELLQAMKVLGIYHGTPYPKNKQFCVPIYGRVRVAEFLEMVQKH
jgi:hypothetical protein